MTTFRVWAPRARHVDVETADGTVPLDRSRPDGWWEGFVGGTSAGSDYAFRLDGGPPRPDPRSLWQPSGVHGPSRVYKHGQFRWSDREWHGRTLAGSVLYEVHIGTFTTGGTFDAAIDRLDHLVDLGVDMVELLPVAAFDGTRGWGYDGVDVFAVHEPYGGPDGLKRFVDACHHRGLGVVLDVVYNHLGPSGNYLSEFGPYFTETHTTPWGPAVNLDAEGSDEVRRWIIDNTLMWLRDYHVDGLRLDAVHALVDTRATHLLEELSAEVDVLATHLRKPLSLIAESDRNDPRTVLPREAHGLGLTGQWADDVHHALHATLTGERQGYYCDFGSLETVADAMTFVFVHAGTWSSFRRRAHGRTVDRRTTAGWRFVTYLQNHDQVGNRARGDRPSMALSPGLQMTGAALLLCSPFTPMLFMGEEWGATTPWQFFTSFPDGDVGARVRDGRRAEFAAHGWSATDVPDPQDVSTFERSRLDWAELDKDQHRELLHWYRRLIALRREHPDLSSPRLDRVRSACDEGARWFVLYREALAVACNLAPQPQTVPLDGTPTDVLVASSDGFLFRPGEIDLPAESVAVARFS